MSSGPTLKQQKTIDKFFSTSTRTPQPTADLFADIDFYRATFMQARSLLWPPCLSVCLPIRLGVTLVHCVQTCGLILTPSRPHGITPSS